MPTPGCVPGPTRRLTSYVLPSEMGVLKVKVPLPGTARLSPRLFCSTMPLPVLASPVTVPPMERVPVEHVIWMLPTFAEAVPLPLVTVQVCAGLFGWTFTVTRYVLPMVIAVLNVKEPLVATARVSAPLFCRTSPVPARPKTLRPMETVAVEHVTWTLVTLALAVPLPLANVQVWDGVEGGVETETRKAWPLAIAVLNVKEPFAVMARLSPALF